MFKSVHFKSVFASRTLPTPKVTSTERTEKHLPKFNDQNYLKRTERPLVETQREWY